MVNPAKIAALFPGQGSQAVGMGWDLAERWPSAASVFEAIDSGLDASLSELEYKSDSFPGRPFHVYRLRQRPRRSEARFLVSAILRFGRRCPSG